MPRRPRRERALITREGWVLVQEDPLEHAVPVVMVEIGERCVRFLFENTVTVEGERGRPLTVSTYIEEEQTSEGGGNGDDPLAGW